MTRQEWVELEQKYEEQVKSIVISATVTETNIKTLIAEIDVVLSMASFDFARAKTAWENQERREKTFTKDYFVRYKDEGCSDKMADARAVKKAEEEGIYNLLNETRRRFNFMQAVLSTLNAKREMLITDSGILKLEASLVQ